MKQQDLFAARPAASEGEAKGPAARPAAAPVPAAPPPAPAPAEEPRPAWRQASAPAPRAPLTVSELTARIKGLLEPPFGRVLLRGEVTGFRGPNARGHLYFALKDERAQVDVRIWQSTARLLKFKLEDGLSVTVEGALNVYEPQGRYSLIVHRIEPEGRGALALAFEQLKAKLAREGLFSRPRRPLPTLPRRIGVVTSVSGAALKDFLKVLHRRHPRLAVLVCDARVQGDGAVGDVCRALGWLSRTDVDVIVVTRGGGSVEDLWTFNEEAVVRAIAQARVPVVSAIGHEIDVTLSDLVADVRAPTPSAAAEVLAPVLSELELGLATAKARLHRAAQRELLGRRRELEALAGALGDPRRALTAQRLFLSEQAERLGREVRDDTRRAQAQLRELAQRLQRARPQAQVRARREALAQLSARLLAAWGQRDRAERERVGRLARALERRSPRPAVAHARQALEHAQARLGALERQRLVLERGRLESLAHRLDALSPLQVLGRGYAIAQRADGRVVRRAADVQVGEPLELRLGHGDLLEATVTKVKPGEP